MHRLNAVFRELRAVADAGQHQKLRRLKGAGGQDDLAPCADGFLLLALHVFDADGALALEQNLRRLRRCFDPQIIAIADMRMHIGARRAPALAIILRHLIGAEAFMIFRVEILANAELRLLRRLPEDVVHGIAGAQLVDAQRPALAVILAVEFGVVLRALEIGQHVRVRPAGVAERSPVIVVPAMSADIDHGVDGGRAAEALAARLIADAAIQPLLRHGLERPVVDLARHHQDQREWRGHDPVVVFAARIEQRDRRPCVFRQPSRHRAAA